MDFDWSVIKAVNITRSPDTHTHTHTRNFNSSFTIAKINKTFLVRMHLAKQKQLKQQQQQLNAKISAFRTTTQIVRTRTSAEEKKRDRELMEWNEWILLSRFEISQREMKLHLMGKRDSPVDVDTLARARTLTHACTQRDRVDRTVFSIRKQIINHT